MDALEFLKESGRMCDSHRWCKGCPLEDGKCVVSDVAPDEDYKRIIAAVERWSKEHPRKTRQSVFLEQYPEARIDVNGVVGLCPTYISAAHGDSHRNCNHPERLCKDCRREFWMQEVE